MAAAQAYTTEALETLASVMRASDSDASRVAASKELLERGHGKSPQPQTGEGGKGPVHILHEVQIKAVWPDDRR